MKLVHAVLWGKKMLAFRVVGGVLIWAIFQCSAAGAAAQGKDRYGWTGAYVGINAGYGWNDSSVALSGDGSLGAGNPVLNVVFANTVSFADAAYSLPLDVSGFVGGGQAGFNWRLGKHWMVGLESDIQYSTLKGSSSATGDDNGLIFELKSEQKLAWFGTTRGRLGFLAAENVLLFGTAGIAYGQTNTSASITSHRTVNVTFNGSTDLFCPPDVPCLAGSDSKVSVGWTIGTGFEYAISQSTTLKAEYLRVDLGHQNIRMTVQAPFAAGNASVGAKFDNAFDIVRTGINVRF